MPPPHRYLHNNFTYVSSCTKYLIFLLNFMFWLFGGLLIGVGLYSFLDKFKATGLIKVDTYYDVLLNISIVLLLAGVIVFIVSFCGCLGESLNLGRVCTTNLHKHLSSPFFQAHCERTLACSNSTHSVCSSSSWPRWQSQLWHSSFPTQ